MNKKGFTLIELLAVIAIIALISMIAIPNIVGLTDGIKKDNMLDDAKKLISLAKYQVNKDYDIRNFTNTTYCNGSSCTFKLEDLNISGDIGDDPDGGSYDQINSTVKYDKSNNIARYCVKLLGSRRTIGKDGCIYENTLYSRSNVKDS